MHDAMLGRTCIRLVYFKDDKYDAMLVRLARLPMIFIYDGCMMHVSVLDRHVYMHVVTLMYDYT